MAQPQAKQFKIAILRALQLGDLLCSVPAIHSLRAAYPDAEITLLGLPWAVSFVQRFNKYFDRFIHFPGFPGLPEQPYSAEAWIKFVEAIEEEQFDLVIQMQGKGTVVNKMLQQLNLSQLAGFDCEEARMDSDMFLEYPDNRNEIERHLELMEHLGIRTKGTHLEFPLFEKDEQDFEKLLLPVESKKYVCIHPGSRSASRQWSPAYFAALADYCIEQGFTAIITGVADEVDITKEVMKCMKHAAIDLTGKTNLGAAAVLIKNAYMLISNCTGVSHIAAAFDTPSIIISLNEEPERWEPLNRKIHRMIDWNKEPHFEKVFTETVKLIKELGNPVIFKSKVALVGSKEKVHYYYS